GVDARAAQALLYERVERETRQVTHVEHDRMTQRNRLLVKRVVGQQTEDSARTRTIQLITLQQLSSEGVEGDFSTVRSHRRGSSTASVPPAQPTQSLDARFFARV